MLAPSGAGMSSALADYLKRELAQRGWTRREAAEALQMSPTAITTLINEPEREPDIKTLRKLADGLKVPIARILDLVGLSIDSALASSKLTDEEEALIARLTPAKRAALLEIIRQMQDGSP